MTNAQPTNAQDRYAAVSSGGVTCPVGSERRWTTYFPLDTSTDGSSLTRSIHRSRNLLSPPTPAWDRSSPLPWRGAVAWELTLADGHDRRKSRNRASPSSALKKCQLRVASCQCRPLLRAFCWQLFTGNWQLSHRQRHRLHFAPMRAGRNRKDQSIFANRPGVRLTGIPILRLDIVRVLFALQICRCFPVLPARNAIGTKPMLSQNRFAAGPVHQQQYSLHPYALRSNTAFSSVAPSISAAVLRRRKVDRSRPTHPVSDTITEMRYPTLTPSPSVVPGDRAVEGLG